MRLRSLLLTFLALHALAAIVVTASGGATQGQPHWAITDLGALGLRASFATAINDRGQVIGYVYKNPKGSYGDPVPHAFLWERGKMRDLGTLGGPTSRALAINDRGQIVGEADTRAKDRDGYFISQVFLWQNGTKRVIKGLRSASPAAITNDGAVVGGWGFDAFLWRQGKLHLPWKGRATAANERGEIVGEIYTGRDTADDYPIMHAVLRRSGRLVDLGTLGGTSSEARSINERGQIVGQADTSATDASSKYGDAIYNAFLWQGGKMRNLGSVARYSQANAVNDRGQVVGWVMALGENQDKRAVLWEAGRTIVLPLLPGGRGSSEAVAMNGRDVIVGWAYGGAIDSPHAVLWTLKRD